MNIVSFVGTLFLRHSYQDQPAAPQLLHHPQMPFNALRIVVFAGCAKAIYGGLPIKIYYFRD